MKRVGLLALGLLIGCSQGSSASSAIPPWQWAVTGMKPGSVAAAPSLVVCEPNGQGCAPAAAGVKLSGSKLVRLERGLSELSIDAATQLEVGEGTELLLTDSPRTIELRSGGMALTRGDTAIQAGPLLVKLVDRTVALIGRASIVARADNLHRAQLFVGQGLATVVDAGGGRRHFHPGEGAVFETKAPPDLAALFNGQLSRFRESVLAVTETPPPPKTVTEPRGFGTMTARVPGTTAVVEGVRLLSHRVRAVVRDGVAQTEVEEVFQNDTSRVLEGRFVFPLPADASISGLTLYVNDKPVEGELVEKKRAAAIFQGIVDDTVRPRDPALLEWVSGSKFSLKVFPLPAKGSRKVVLRYQQALTADGPRQTYVYPMSFGAERATKIDDLAIELELSDSGQGATAVVPSGYAATIEPGPTVTRVRMRASGAAPDHDFAVSFSRPTVTSASATSEAGFVALRLRAELPTDVAVPEFQRKDRVVVLDGSQSQSAESLAAARLLAKRILLSLEPDERFALLVCDSACESVPKTGFATATGAPLGDAVALIDARKPSGASDLAGALRQAAERADAGAPVQVVYVGDGSPTAGELSVVSIADRVRESFERRRVDLRLFGVGASVDGVTLRALSRTLSGSYDELSSPTSLGEHAHALVTGLRQPLVVAPVLEVPGDVTELAPRDLPNLRLGQEFIVAAKRGAASPFQVTLRGRLNGAAYVLTRAVQPAAPSALPFAARLWAQGRIAELEASSDPSSLKEVIQLSQRFRVMSRHTSWLVLESEQMFADFGITRTVPPPPSPPSDAEDAAREVDQVDLGALVPPGAAEDAKGNASRPEPAKKAEAEAPSRAAPRGPSPADAQAPAAPAPAPPSSPKAEASEGAASGLGSSGSGVGVKVPGARGNVSVGAVSVSGGTVANAARVAAGLRSGARACYHRALAEDPSAQGSLRLTLRVGTKGEVQGVSPAPSGSMPAGLIACVVALAQRTTFDAPQGGAAVVALRMTFTSDGGGVSDPGPPGAVVVRPRPVEDVATIRAGDESWALQGQAALDKLAAELTAAPTSRKRHEALVRGLLLRGRFQPALAAAERFVAADPDSALAHELLAYAAVATGDKRRAATTADAITEAAASDVKAHGRAARALESLGDEARACAHWRSMLELLPTSDSARYEALRCRARVLKDGEAALREARAFARPGPLLSRLIPLLEAAQPPPFEKSTGAVGQLEISLSCDGVGECPYAIVITPTGTVFSPWTPALGRSSATSFAFSGLMTGAYRVVLVGGAPGARGKVDIRALNARTTLPFVTGQAPTLATIQVTVGARVTPGPPRLR